MVVQVFLTRPFGYVRKNRHSHLVVWVFPYTTTWLCRCFLTQPSRCAGAPYAGIRLSKENTSSYKRVELHEFSPSEQRASPHCIGSSEIVDHRPLYKCTVVPGKPVRLQRKTQKNGDLRKRNEKNGIWYFTEDKDNRYPNKKH